MKIKLIILVLLICFLFTIPQQNCVKAGTTVFDSSQSIFDTACNDKNNYVAVGKNGRIIVSSDGMSWENVYSGVNQYLLGVICNDKKFITVGYNGVILVSGDGKGWGKIDSPVGCRLSDVSWGQYGFVAVGDSGTIITSIEGADWKTVSSGTTNNLRGVTWDGTHYIAVGDKGTILISKDGCSWEKQTSGIDSYLFSVIWDGKELVAVGNTILTSPDGINWTDRSPNENRYLFSVATNGKELLALGDFGQIISSTDTSTWKNNNSPSDVGINGLIWDGTKYIFGDETGRVYYSNDGNNWRQAWYTERLITHIQAVAKTVPQNMEDMVDVTTPIEIYFTGGFYFDTTVGVITLRDSSGNEIIYKNIALSNTDRSKIALNVKLKNNTLYTVTVREGAAFDSQSNPSKEYTFSFRTVKKEPEQAIQKTVPYNGQTNVNIKSPIEIYFKEGYKFNSSVGVFTITDTNGNVVADRNIIMSLDNPNKISILFPLRNDMQYTIKFSEGTAINLEGTVSKEYVFRFKTVRKTELAIQKTIPANGLTNVSVTSLIKIYLKNGFKQNKNGSITLTDPTGKKIPCRQQVSSRAGVITYKASLMKNTKYVVTLGEGFGYDGKDIYSTPYNFSFTTKKK